jgi:hypothetical protein
MCGSRYSFFTKNPSFTLTLSYLYVSFLGAVEAYNFYRAFNVNFLRFAGPRDYLTAAFGDALNFLIGASAVVAGFGLYYLLRWLEVNLSLKATSLPSFSIEGLVLVILLGASWYAWNRGSERATELRHMHPTLEVQLAGSEKPVNLIFLGDIGLLRFFYKPDVYHVIAVPSLTVLSMEFSGAAK